VHLRWLEDVGGVCGLLTEVVAKGHSTSVKHMQEEDVLVILRRKWLRLGLHDAVFVNVLGEYGNRCIH
jgi:hypothetical protein